MPLESALPIPGEMGDEVGRQLTVRPANTCLGTDTSPGRDALWAVVVADEVHQDVDKLLRARGAPFPCHKRLGQPDPPTLRETSEHRFVLDDKCRFGAGQFDAGTGASPCKPGLRKTRATCDSAPIGHAGNGGPRRRINCPQVRMRHPGNATAGP